MVASYGGLVERNSADVALDELIVALYNGALLRKPEAGAVRHWLDYIASGRTVQDLIGDFLKSPEFCARFLNKLDLYPFDLAPRQHIDVETDKNTLDALWDRVRTAWSLLGVEDPYFSVLTDPRYREQALSQLELIEAFYNTGRWDLQRLERWLERSGISVKANGVCIEYGCGVGRISEWLANRFGKVIAMDISASHLELARRRANARNVRGVEYVNVSNRGDLQKLRGADLFYSIIVLQHNPPPIISDILEAAFSGLNSGGIAYFQVQTYGAQDYHFQIDKYVGNVEQPKMEMHVLDQQTIFRLAHRHGLIPNEVSQDHCTGGVGVSTTFLFTKT